MSLADLPTPSAPQAEAVSAPEVAVPETPSPAASLPVPFSSIAAGKLPGLQIPPISKADGVPDDLQNYVVQNLHVLIESGIDYHDLPNHTTVLFNPESVTVPEIEKAYKDGNLDKVVPTAKQFKDFVQKQAEAAPVASQPAEGGALASAPSPAAPAASGATPPGVARARLANLTAPKPIAPNPIPNQLAKRAI